jgi:hypothetical protein
MMGKWDQILDRTPSRKETHKHEASIQQQGLESRAQGTNGHGLNLEPKMDKLLQSTTVQGLHQ